MPLTPGKGQGRVLSSFLGHSLCAQESWSTREGCLLHDLRQEEKQNLSLTNKSRARKIPTAYPVILEVSCSSGVLPGDEPPLGTRGLRPLLGLWGVEGRRSKSPRKKRDQEKMLCNLALGSRSARVCSR